MHTRLVTALLSAALLAGHAAAQNELRHYDGTTDFTSRGSSATAVKTLMQRMPADLAGGAQNFIETQFVVQDQNGTTSESFTLEVRANNVASPNSPDMSAGGVLGFAGPFSVTFPCPDAACAVQFTLTLSTAIPLANSTTSPAGDFYTCLALPAAPLWTADGISVHASGVNGANLGEQMNAAGDGYLPGGVGLAGMAWEYNVTTGAPPALNTSNRAWNPSVRLVEDVCQGFADNPVNFTGVNSGLNPNYGYAGIWPDTTRPDATADKLGVRARTTNPVGTPVLLIFGLAPLAAPTTVSGVAGQLCIAPPFKTTATVLTVLPPVGQAIPETEAIFGPNSVPPAFVGMKLYIQAVSFGSGGPRLSTMTKVSIVN